MTLYDIINLNKKTYPAEVRSFFQVMEVYGQCADLDPFRDGYRRFSTPNMTADPLLYPVSEDTKDKLKALRIMSLDQLTLVT